MIWWVFVAQCCILVKASLPDRSPIPEGTHVGTWSNTDTACASIYSDYADDGPFVTSYADEDEDGKGCEFGCASEDDVTSSDGPYNMSCPQGQSIQINHGQRGRTYGTCVDTADEGSEDEEGALLNDNETRCLNTRAGQIGTVTDSYVTAFSSQGSSSSRHFYTLSWSLFGQLSETRSRHLESNQKFVIPSELTAVHPGVSKLYRTCATNSKGNGRAFLHLETAKSKKK